jgi:hypothetical protein
VLLGRAGLPPNYSLKRTVQSLRDWSCRLAQALGGWRSRSVSGECLPFEFETARSGTSGEIDFGLPAPVGIHRQAHALRTRFGVASRRARARTKG